jgi:hypothetical protein
MSREEKTLLVASPLGHSVMRLGTLVVSQTWKFYPPLHITMSAARALFVLICCFCLCSSAVAGYFGYEYFMGTEKPCTAQINPQWGLTAALGEGETKTSNCSLVDLTLKGTRTGTCSADGTIQLTTDSCTEASASDDAAGGGTGGTSGGTTGGTTLTCSATDNPGWGMTTPVALNGEVTANCSLADPKKVGTKVGKCGSTGKMTVKTDGCEDGYLEFMCKRGGKYAARLSSTKLLGATGAKVECNKKAACRTDACEAEPQTNWDCYMNSGDIFTGQSVKLSADFNKTAAKDKCNGTVGRCTNYSCSARPAEPPVMLSWQNDGTKLNKCLDVSAGMATSGKNGQGLQIYTCQKDNWNQIFRPVNKNNNVNPTTYVWENNGTIPNKCLSVADGINKPWDGQSMIIWDCDLDHATQKFKANFDQSDPNLSGTITWPHVQNTKGWNVSDGMSHPDDGRGVIIWGTSNDGNNIFRSKLPM